MKTAKKILSFVLSCCLILSVATTFSFAEDQIKVTLRVEGISENLSFKQYTVKEGTTALELVKLADEKAAQLTIKYDVLPTGTYISEINKIKDHHFGKDENGEWRNDGWYYTVNYVDPEVALDKYIVKNNDDIVIYYGDPVAGFDYPEIDLSNFDKGIVRFISYNKDLDSNGNFTYKVKPITNAMVTWTCGSKVIKTSTDSRGEIFLTQEYRANTYFTVQIEKTAANGMPLLLRFEPHYMVSVDGATSDVKMENILTKVYDVILRIVAIFVSIFKGDIDFGDLIN